MEFKKIITLCALVCVFATGCGRSQSPSEDTNKISIEDQALLQHCTDFPNSNQCQEIRREGLDLGLNDFFGNGDGSASNNAFGNSGIGCGCQHDEKVVQYKGYLLCEPHEVFETVSVNQVYVRFIQRPSATKRAWVAFNDANIEITGNQTQSTGFIERNSGGSCQNDFGTRCTHDSDCAVMGDLFLNRIRSVCEPIAGTQYGACTSL